MTPEGAALGPPAIAAARPGWYPDLVRFGPCRLGIAAIVATLGTPVDVAAAPAVPATTEEGRVQLDRVVAVVGDEIILHSQMSSAVGRSPLLREAQATLPPNASPQVVAARMRDVEARVLDDLIDLALMKAEAERFELTATPADVDRALPNVAAQYGLTVDELRKQVEASEEYASWAEYREDLRGQILQYKVSQYLATWSVSDAQVREHYRKMTKDEGAKVKVDQFLFVAGADPDARNRAFSRAQQVARRLKGGESAPDVAKAIGYDRELERTVGRGEMAPKLEDAAFAAKAGSVVGPLASGQGYVVFKVVEHVASAALSFEEAKDRIRAQLEQEAFIKAEQELKRQLRAKAHIDIRL